MVGAKEIISSEVGIVVNGFELNVWRLAILDFVKKEFTIPTDFAEQKELTVQQHCKQIIAFATELK